MSINVNFSTKGIVTVSINDNDYTLYELRMKKDRTRIETEILNTVDKFIEDECNRPQE